MKKNETKADGFSLDELEKKEKELLAELEEYNREKEKIKDLLGKVGGTSYSRTDTIINAIFLAIILTFFILEMTTKFLPSFISLEISVLLVSIKIVWMIHSQHKFNHFQFWILNTIEYRMNNVDTRMKKMEKSVAEIRENQNRD